MTPIFLIDHCGSIRSFLTLLSRKYKEDYWDLITRVSVLVSFTVRKCLVNHSRMLDIGGSVNIMTFLSWYTWVKDAI